MPKRAASARVVASASPDSGLEWRMSAEPITGLPPAVELGVGGSSACARTAQGEVYCWGSNRAGAVPDTAPRERASAVVVNLEPED